MTLLETLIVFCAPGIVYAIGYRMGRGHARRTWWRL